MKCDNLQALQDLGFNFMRVYVAWQGVTPSPGVINTTYLDQVEALVALLSAHNISSILDCHQDVLAPAFCGEGRGAAASRAPV
jgi:endoglycosylceramidase